MLFEVKKKRQYLRLDDVVEVTGGVLDDVCSRLVTDPDVVVLVTEASARLAKKERAALE